MNISTPGNSLYGQHLSQHAVNMFLQPQPLVQEEIMGILHAFGIQRDSIGHKRQWITFTTSVTTAEQFLDTKFHYYHKANGASIIRTLKYSVPQEIYEHVQLIQPTTCFGVVKPQVRHIVGESEAVNPANIFTGYDARRCNRTITPDCLRGLYQLGNSTNVPASSNGNSLGVSGFLEEWASYQDLSLFTSNFAPYASEKNFSVVSVNGGKNQQFNPTQESREANLDVRLSQSSI
jgi:tripeptidyl-peptidase I